MIGVINYKAGNATSVLNALDYLGISGKFVSTPREIMNAAKLILPGVGSARATVDSLKEMNCLDVIEKRVVCDRVPFMGICVGLQILFDYSEEGDAECLGWFKGKVVKFSGDKVRVPHIGWNDVRFTRNHPLISGIKRSEFFYFVNSYYAVPEDKDIILGRTEYHYDFCSVLLHRNILATQFHAEKSGSAGLKLLKNFAEIEDILC